NPFALRQEIASAAWRGEQLNQFAAKRVGVLPSEDREAISDEQHLGRPDLLVLDALQAYDAQSEWRAPVAEPQVEPVLAGAEHLLGPSGLASVRDAVAQGQMADVLPAALQAMVPNAPQLVQQGIFEAGNALVMLMENLPEHTPDGPSLIRAYAALCTAAGGSVPDMEQQLGWMLAQGDLDTAIADCCALMGDSDAAVARAASKVLGHAVEYRALTYGPQYGAGPGSPETTWTPIGATDEELIETPWFRSRMAPREEAAAAPGDDEDGRTRTGAPDDDFELQGADGDETSSAEDARTAYAKLDCPSAVAPDTWFEVDVGLSKRPSSGVTGGAMTLPASMGDTFDVTIHLVADGFRVHEDDALDVTLKVTPDQQYPTATVRLSALDDAQFGPHRLLMAQFAVGGQMIGAAARSVQVNADAVAADQGETAQGVDMVVPPQAEAPDLTITITKGNTLRADRLVWSLESPHGDIDTSPPADEAAVISDLGAEPGIWSRNLMNQVHVNATDQSSLIPLLRGAGSRIAAKIPVWVRQRLYQLSQMPGDPKSIMIVSNEPNVPWELAWIEVDGGDNGENFCGAEFSVGRWVIGTPSAVTGKVKPPYPPPVRLDVSRMAVVSGDYTAVRRWNDLAGAHEEAAELQKRYGAESVEADETLAAWLDSAEGFDLIHFAVHGKSDISGGDGGIVLTNGKMLAPDLIAGLRLKGSPFIFLNACQLGQGEETLADYGGVAAAFLEAGAGGVIAALWNVDDAAARDLALNFYMSGAELKSGASRFIRDVRARFGETVPDNDPAARAPSLFLAYQFFGHPRMRLGLNFPAPDNTTDTEV
ncbi:MAG: CHAT domain-containing protein, partial [Pseudomonadota bacterium]